MPDINGSENAPEKPLRHADAPGAGFSPLRLNMHSYIAFHAAVIGYGLFLIPAAYFLILIARNRPIQILEGGLNFFIVVGLPGAALALIFGLVGLIKPEIVLSIVVLPAPLAPISVTISP